MVSSKCTKEISHNALQSVKRHPQDFGHTHPKKIKNPSTMNTSGSSGAGYFLLCLSTGKVVAYNVNLFLFLHFSSNNIACCTIQG
jgi:hypothetical protein